MKIPRATFLDESLLDCSTFDVSYDLRRDEEKLVERMQLQPNPAGKEVMITAPVKPMAAGMLTIRDAAGRPVYEEFIPALPLRQFQTLVMLESVPAGVYLIEIAQGEMRSVERLVVQR